MKLILKIIGSIFVGPLSVTAIFYLFKLELFTLSLSLPMLIAQDLVTASILATLLSLIAPLAILADWLDKNY